MFAADFPESVRVEMRRRLRADYAFADAAGKLIRSLAGSTEEFPLVVPEKKV